MNRKLSKRDIRIGAGAVLVFAALVIGFSIYKGYNIIGDRGFSMLLMIISIAVMLFIAAVSAEVKKRRANKKEALRCLGKDIDLSMLRKDKGAMLAYKGIMQCLDENYQNGAYYFEEALKLPLGDHNGRFCYDWLRHCYAKLDYKDKYVDALKRSVQALPTDDEVLYMYGDYLAMNGSYEKALYYFNQAVKYNPNNESAYDSLGQIAMDRMEYEKAIEYFNKAIKINENYIDAICLKAVCYAAMDDFENAEKFMTQAMAMDGKNRYEHYKQKLDNIRKIKNGDLRKETEEA